jgi:hypothetical protein
MVVGRVTSRGGGVDFPSLGKMAALFSGPRENMREIFQCLEKPAFPFPILGKSSA